ncbi:MAG: hypothetical protein QXR45_16080 [Candidatus Bathyarchaeia archaeon]
MKKRILMLTLVLMIVLSSFSVVFGIDKSNINYLDINSLSATQYAKNLALEKAQELENNGYRAIIILTGSGGTDLYFQVFGVLSSRIMHITYDDNGAYINKGNSMYEADAKASVWFGKTSGTNSITYGEASFENLVSGSNRGIVLCNTVLYEGYVNDSNNKGSIIYDPTPPLNVYVKIKAGQQLNLVYENSVRNQVLKSVDTTDNVVLNFWVSKDGKPSSLSAGQVADSWFNRIDINSIPYMPELDEGEMYSIGLYGKSTSNIPFLPDSNIVTNEATFEIDITKCQYSVTSTLTGLPIDAGTIDTTETGPPASNGNQIPGLVDMDETKDGISRSDYQEGIVGDIEYQFDRLISFIKLPFTILLSFFVNLGDIIQYALGSVGALTGSLKSLYGILPASIAYLMTFAITITIFKLIFGR